MSSSSSPSDDAVCPHARAASLDAATRTARHLSTGLGDEASHDLWRVVQRGLVYPSPYARFATFWRSAAGRPITKAILRDLMSDVRRRIHTELGSANTTAIVGVGFFLWREWCAEEGSAPPAGMELLFPVDGAPYRSRVFERSNGTFADSAGDLWFHVKSDREKDCEVVFGWIRDRLVAEECVDPQRTVFQDAATKSTQEDKLGGKVLGCRFSENLNNPASPVSIQEQTIVGFEDAAHLGASYALAQRLRINWELVLNLSYQQIEDLVGRTVGDDILIPTNDSRSHIKCSRVQDEAGNTTQVLRLGLPFGRSPYLDDEDLALKGVSIRDEAGIYFAGYAKSARVFERILESQIGDTAGFLRDRLLSNVRSDLGGLFYIPSVVDLGLEPVEWKGRDELAYESFPGVQWERLDRHFRGSSPSPYMFYNHKDYLFQMGTMNRQEREEVQPPSNRVLRLLADAFSRWQDTWYFDRKQEELQHLAWYLRRDPGRYGEGKAEEVMQLSVAERMGWAVKVSLGDAFVDPDYGFRGRRRKADGNWYNGADTYRIHPLELIVGALPNLGLGQGRYVIDYTREDEGVRNFFLGLSPASGVGHVVPTFRRVLERGIGGMIADLERRRDAAAEPAKRRFYNGVILAFEGIRDHCRAYARLAGEMAARMAPGQKAERENLLAIQERMERLSAQPAESMLDAVQLVFTFHSCLHLVGEPTAVGRLDQMLDPFYQRDMAAGRLTDEEAQEIVDCFWIKVAEKVLLNRQFVEDHQPFGNLAMGGASGPYPQGGANNQWIQQVTVGGTVADDGPEARPAYNRVTVLCLRAARRLPLNAPCLSLRVRHDTPREILREAAKAILSGGAHPILLQDDKIIPGLHRSGDRVGDGTGETPSTPVRERAGGCWQSEVALSAARDYACDGCYEPQIAGLNWFTLNGMCTLVPLECALNQGKGWISAGPMYFRGQRASFTSPAPRDIKSFGRLLDLFYEHLRWLYAKQVDGLLAIFGQMSDVCPSPLLSALIDDCLDKGLDFYAGGARYNVVAPCFTGLSTTVNSLWAIHEMVFNPSTAVTSLPELVEALLCDWGHKMVEPFVSTLAGTARIEAKAERFKKLREIAAELPRYGRGHAGVDRFGDEIARRVAAIAVETFTNPVEPTAEKMVALAGRLGTPEQPFGGFQIQPGVGTFENYLEFGAMFGASADGRRLGEPLASDLSPSPSFADLPVEHQAAVLFDVLDGYQGDGSTAMWSGAPTDLNIREDFPLEVLEEALARFASGAGSNILTITCASPDTLEEAARSPEKYDLLRVRMGGWSEFFVAMFPSHQEQHQRRPLHAPGPGDWPETGVQV